MIEKNKQMKSKKKALY